jgi:hypothetical protein
MTINLKLFKLVGRAIQGPDQTVPLVKAAMQRINERLDLARPLPASD